MGVAGLLLAAGAGRRLGRPKAIVELGGLTLAERGVSLLRDGGADPIVMVTGAVDVELPQVTAVRNADWQTGMGSSLRVGLAALPSGSSAVVIGLVDQPLISPQAVRRLIEAFDAGAQVAVASYGGQRRNPVLIGQPYWSMVASSADADYGAREFLRAHSDLVTLVECGDVGCADDLDTPDDLRRIAGLMSGAGPRSN